MDFKRATYFELFRRAETSARVSAPKLRKRFWNLVTVIFGVPKKSKLAIILEILYLLENKCVNTQ